MTPERQPGGADSGVLPRASNLRPRVPPSAPPSAPDVGQLDAVLEIGDLVSGPGRLADAFEPMVRIMRKVTAFDAVAINTWSVGTEPLRCYYTTRAEEREHLGAVADAASKFFAESGPLEPFEALTAPDRSRWMSLPLTDPGGAKLGVIVVRSHAALDELALTFVACVARSVASALARELRGTEVTASRLARGVVESGSRANALAAALTSAVFSSFDYLEALKDVVRLLDAGFACSCVVDIEGADGVVQRIAEEPLQGGPGILPALTDLVGEVMARQRTLVRDGRDPSPRPLGPSPVASAVGMMSAPILSGGRAVGAISVIGWYEPISDTFLEALATSIGVAFDNARAYAAVVLGLRTRDEVLATVSHDLRSPLSVILMSAARIVDTESKGDASPASSRKEVERIERNAQRMQRLVTDLLDYASLEAGAMAMNPGPCDLQKLVNDAVQDARGTAAASNVEVLALPSSEIPTLNLDKHRIAQVLVNLVTNAVKFAKPGGNVVVSADFTSRTTAPDFTERKEVAVRVTDTGCGIAPESIPHLFDRFWQAHPSHGVGAGLGLAIAKAIVERSGGRIWAESSLGEGTTMTFTVPLPR